METVGQSDKLITAHEHVVCNSVRGDVLTSSLQVVIPKVCRDIDEVPKGAGHEALLWSCDATKSDTIRKCKCHFLQGITGRGSQACQGRVKWPQP